MTITINGTTGVAGVDGTAATPALQGNDTDTGVYFGTNEVYISTGGTLRATVGNSGLTLTTPLVFPAGAVGAPSITTTGDTNTGIYFPAADTIGFATSGAASMTLDASGTLGLGVTPSAWVSVRAFQFPYGAIGADSSGYPFFVNNGYESAAGTWTRITGSLGSSYYRQSFGTHEWLVAGSGAAGGTISFTQAMTLTADGVLGVGNTSPGTYARIAIEKSGADAAISFKKTGVAAVGYVATDGVDFWVGSSVGSTGKKFFVNLSAPDNAATIDSSGNLLVGDTSTYADSKIYVNSASTTNSRQVATFQNTGATSTAQKANRILSLKSNGSGADVSIQMTDSAANDYFLGGANAELYAICNTGGMKLTNGAISWSSNSDERLKNITGYYTNPLNDITQIKPIKFTWKDGNDKPFVGVSAQSVQKVIPEAVEEGADGYLSVRYTDMLPLVIASIQELAAKVSALEAKQ